MNPDHEPTADESVECAAVFVAACDADNATAATDLLIDYMGDDPRVGHMRLWGLLSAGALLVAHAVKQKVDVPEGWLMGLRLSHGDIHEGAAVRAVSCHLNQDYGAAADVIAAHEKVASLRGLIAMLTNLVWLFRDLGGLRAIRGRAS